MKTLFLFEEYEDLFFFQMCGSFKHLDGTYLNSTGDEDKQQELQALVYDDDGNRKIESLVAPTKDWDYFVRCGIV
jgi:hypothetical protein